MLNCRKWEAHVLMYVCTYCAFRPCQLGHEECLNPESQLAQKFHISLMWREKKTIKLLEIIRSDTCQELQARRFSCDYGKIALEQGNGCKRPPLTSKIAYISTQFGIDFFCKINEIGSHLWIAGRPTLFLDTSRSCTPSSIPIPTLMSTHPPCVNTRTLLSVLQESQGPFQLSKDPVHACATTGLTHNTETSTQSHWDN